MLRKGQGEAVCASLVRLNIRRTMEATGMSRVTEMIDVDTMIGRTLIDGKVVAEFKCEQCDHCQRIEILDRAGYQRDVSGEPILWFCGKCRK